MSFVNSSLPRTAAHPPQFSPREFRDALGMFATGVAIVTARSENGQPLGMTINSFNSVSLEPPLVLWSLAQRSSLLQALTLTRHCAIHVLTAAQRPLAERFATRGIDRWAGVEHQLGLQGVPVIAGAADTTIFLRCSRGWKNTLATRSQNRTGRIPETRWLFFSSTVRRWRNVSK